MTKSKSLPVVSDLFGLRDLDFERERFPKYISIGLRFNRLFINIDKHV